MFECQKILVAGDIMLDRYSFGVAKRISPEAPVPILWEYPKEIKDVLGGAANVALNSMEIGINEISVFGVCGNDEEGNKLLQLLEDTGINTQFIYRDKRRQTTVKHRYIAQNNQQIFRVDYEDTKSIEIACLNKIFKVLESRLEEYSLFLLSDYNKGFLTEEICQKFIKLAKKNAIPILVDVKGNQVSKYKGATLLKPNKEELQILTSVTIHTIEDVVEAAILLCKMAECKYVLTTLGADGMVLTDNRGLLLQVKSAAQEVYDVTGAGDTSIAYLAAELARGKDIFEAVRIANYAAGVQVSKVGTSVVYPWEVRDMMYGRKKENANKELFFYRNHGMDAVEKERGKGKKIVFTNGCFDILHVGHIEYLRKAKTMGDCLIIGVNSDASVRRLKGKTRPVNALADRLTLLSALEFVDYVVSFEEDTPEELIEAVRPDVLVKGGDYRIEDIVGAEYVQSYGGEVMTIPLIEGKSTTGIIEKMKQ